MLGRNQSKPQPTLVSQESSNGPKANSGPLLTIVGSSAKLEGKFEIAETGRVTGNIETDSLVISRGQRPVHLVDGARAVTTQR